MTVIAAALTDKGVVMACDAQTSAGWHKIRRDVPKLWVAGDYVFGAAGSVRSAQVVRHHVTWPKFRPDEVRDFEAFAVKELVPAIRDASRNHGALHTSSGIESVECTLLMSVADNIVEICDDGSVISEPSRRMAIGSGYAQALGRLGDTGPWSEDDVVDAVRQAIVSNGGCGGPITVVNARTKEMRTLQ